jgi:NAD(P)H-dependent flavin oxidoreductase YrpB (nitropropane dioxygenase family)
VTSDVVAGGLPEIIQGGMGVAVSGWELARAVALEGQLGVVSGTALDVVHARRLADGDLGGHLRRAYREFPLGGIADRVVERWYRPAGREARAPYPAATMFRARPARSVAELTMLANFAEVWLAKEGHRGVVGVNYLEKIQIPTLPAVYGALLAGVDVVLMGAGIPSALPGLVDGLVDGRPVRLRIDVEGDGPDASVELDPHDWWDGEPPPLARPAFLAIVSSHALASYLAKDVATRPDGFVIEGPVAGGHNAPPRGRLRLDATGQPVYGPRDAVDLDVVGRLGLPYWLAGGYGRTGGLDAARALGARGIQVGTAFALCHESGMAAHLKDEIIAATRAGSLRVTTDPLASPSGYPFKIANVRGTLADSEVHQRRRRVCDLGYLRSAYRRRDGSVGLRCPGEPVDAYVRKGGSIDDTAGRVCLCNGLMATAGLAQARENGPEPALVTLGDDTAVVVRALDGGAGPWTAAEVVRHLLDGSGSPPGGDGGPRP